MSSEAGFRAGLRWLAARRDLVIVYGALAALFIVGVLGAPHFSSSFNLTSLLGASLPLALVAIGQTVVVVTGGIDLSVGSTMSLAAVMAAMAMNGHDGRIFQGTLLCLAVGAGIGLANGLAVSRFRVQPIVATLGALSIVQGLALLRSNNGPQGLAPPKLQALVYGDVGPVPQAVLVLVVAFALGGFILRRTRFGMQLYALGGSEQAARLTGIHVMRLQIAAYVLCGCFSGLAGVLLSARLGIGDPISGQVFLLTSVAAVAIGGTSLFGGRGGLAGTIAGVLILTILNNVLTLRGVGTYPQQLITGLLIVVVVALYSARLRIQTTLRRSTAASE